jgi:hypothetical protein
MQISNEEEEVVEAVIDILGKISNPKLKSAFDH